MFYLVINFLKHCNITLCVAYLSLNHTTKVGGKMDVV